MKRFIILMLGVFLLFTNDSTATPLENIGVQVEMSYKYGNNINSSVGPRRTKGQPNCPVLVYANNIDKCITFVGVDDNMDISYVITNEFGEDIAYGYILNDSCMIETSTLANGLYTLQIIINDVCYCGIFLYENPD